MMIWRFRRLLEAYGANPAHWPPDERAAAEALCGRSAEARAALAEARRLDRLLAVDALAGPDDALTASIIARTTAVPQERPAIARATDVSGWSMPPLWQPAAGLLAAALIGFVVGWANLLPPVLGGEETVDLSDYVGAGAGAGTGTGTEEPLP